MTLGDIAVKARALTHTDTTSYTDANLLIDINIWYQKIVSMILESADEVDFDDNRRTNYPIQTTPMVAGQRDYTMPVTEKVLKIKRVDVTYDGSHWFRADPFDDGVFPYGMGSDTEIDANFIKQSPKYDPKYNSLFIYPLAAASDVAAGASIRVEWERQIIPFVVGDYTSVLTDSTVVPGFDDPFHPMLSAGAAFEKAKSDQLPNMGQLGQDLVDWETRLRFAYSKKLLDTDLSLSPRGNAMIDYH